MSARITRIAGPLLVGIFLFATPLVAQTNMYVLIPEVPGESTEPAHPDWIVAFGLTHSFTICIDPMTVGPCGPAVFSEVAFLKLTDVSTPLLHQRVVTGQPISEVTIDVCAEPAGSIMCYYTLRLANVVLTRLDLAGSACEDPGSCGGAETESVSLTFSEVEWTFTPFQDGEPQPEISECWNVETNAPC